MAERFNIIVKTVKKYTAEPREQYEQTAADRQADQLRSQGLKWQQVADKMSCCITEPLPCIAVMLP